MSGLQSVQDPTAQATIDPEGKKMLEMEIK